MQNFSDAIKNSLDFKGRIRREGFMLRLFFFFLPYFILAAPFHILLQDIQQTFQFIEYARYIYLSLIFTPISSLVARRLHDFSFSGAWGWLLLVPELFPVVPGSWISLIIHLSPWLILVYIASANDNQYGKKPVDTLTTRPSSVAGISPFPRFLSERVLICLIFCIGIGIQLWSIIQK